MNSKICGVIVFFVIFQSSLTFAKDRINVVLLPDPFSCHQLGIEKSVTNNSRLGILGVINCSSDRPTYGSANGNVMNTFSRVLIPWTYANGAWENGYFFKMLVGLEQHDYLSNNGSHAQATFLEFSPQVGYQWFWQNGVNVSASFGVAFLFANESNRDISLAESQEVIDFLDKNTKTNQHFAFGIILGWVF
jgi:hypothetical protein